MSCPLCQARSSEAYFRDATRSYLRCGRCQLIHVPAQARLGAAEEKARYALHRNDAGDAGYRAFLSRLVDPLLDVVPAGAEGLDFGCGPTPVLADLLRARGCAVQLYDPYFAPDETVWQRRYDFISASEVFEHLHDPSGELDRLFAALRPRGVLAVMTAFAPPSVAAFAAWHYIRDPTHVAFYGRAVFEHIADRGHASAQFPAPDVVLLTRA